MYEIKNLKRALLKEKDINKDYDKCQLNEYPNALKKIKTM